MTESTDPAPYLGRVKLGGLPGLISQTELELDQKRTVLVGRNGAGKTLILEGLCFATRAAILGINPRRTHHVPSFFECEVVFPDGERIGFTYTWTEEQKSDSDDDDAPPLWSERCWRIGSREEIWRVEDGVLRQANCNPIAIGPGMGGLSIRKRLRDVNETQEPRELRLVRGALFPVNLVSCGNIRGMAPRGREPVFLMASLQGGRRRWQARLPQRTRVGHLAASIANMYESSRDDFNELVELMRRLKLAKDVELSVFEYEQPDAREEREAIGIPRFDGVDIGDLSDGTLRVVEIVLGLIMPSRMLFIEEPELAVHPGLLDGLLALVESYGIDRQVIISTHSPHVVSWCQPEHLRFVRRAGTTTSVHKLDSSQVERVCQFLSDEGTLGDYVFSCDEHD